MKANPLVIADADRERVLAGFLKYVAATGPDSCWEWVGSRHPLGYGQFAIGRRQLRAHRVGYALFTGPLMDVELTIDHLCRNRGCVNPEHLELVTFQENLRRRRLDVRGLKCAKGHDYVPRGNVRGRQSCKQCYTEYMREFNAKARARRKAAKDAA